MPWRRRSPVKSPETAPRMAVGGSSGKSAIPLTLSLDPVRPSAHSMPNLFSPLPHSTRQCRDAGRCSMGVPPASEVLLFRTHRDADVQELLLTLYDLKSLRSVLDWHLSRFHRPRLVKLCYNTDFTGENHQLNVMQILQRWMKTS